MDTNIVTINIPEDIKDKEQYLSQELYKYKEYDIKTIRKLEGSSLQIVFKGNIKGKNKKYFVRVCDKDNYTTAKQYVGYYKWRLKINGCKKYPELFEELEYDRFFIIFFVTKKRRTNKK